MILIRRLAIIVTIISIQSCATTESYTKTDKHNRYISVYSTTDRRSAMESPEKDSDINKSVARLEEEVKKDPRDVQSLLNLANLLVAQNKLEDAEDAARKAIRLDIKNLEAKKALAQIALRRGQFGLCSIILNSAGGDQLKDADILNMLALVAMAGDEPSKAMSLFQRALKIDPGNVSVRMNLGVSYLKYRMLQAAAVQFERVTKLVPDNADALMHLAVIRSAKGDFDTAEEIYENILGKKKNNPIALYNLAVLQQRKGEYDEALENLKVYLKNSQAKSKDTDQAFALIERIKDLQLQKGKANGVSDEEIQALAEEVEVKKVRSASTNAASKAKETGAASKTPESSDAEVDALEKALIE